MFVSVFSASAVVGSFCRSASTRLIGSLMSGSAWPDSLLSGVVELMFSGICRVVCKFVSGRRVKGHAVSSGNTAEVAPWDISSRFSFIVVFVVLFSNLVLLALLEGVSDAGSLLVTSVASRNVEAVPVVSG